MILQSLVNYYDILLEKNMVARPNGCSAKVSFAIDIDDDGALRNLIPLKQEVLVKKKLKEIPQTLVVPEQVKKSSGVASNFLCENSGYLLGFDQAGKPNKALERFLACKKLHQSVLACVNDDGAKAVLAFFNTWQPELLAENLVLQDKLDALAAGGSIVFMYRGEYVHNRPAEQQAWETFKQKEEDEVIGRCLVTGEVAPIARLHPSIKGVRGAQSSGASLVSFNADADLSYGMYEHDHSATRGKMAVRELIVFKHASELGNAPSHVLFDTVTVQRKNPNDAARCYGDYEVAIAQEKIPESVTCTRMI